MSGINVGSFVTHRNLPQLGVGKVFCVGDVYACVGFIDDAGKRDVKRIARSFVQLVVAGEPLPQFDGWIVETTSDCYPVVAVGPVGKSKKTKPGGTSAQWTLEQAYERFLGHYPDGMAGEHYRRAERAWKAQQGELWRQLFPEGRFRTLISNDPQAAGALVMKVIQTKEAALLATRGELPMLNWALRQGQPAQFLLALADVLESSKPTAESLGALIDALETIPTRESATRLLTWPNLTVVPFLVRPDQHMFLKPKPTKEAARMLGIDLFYNSRPSWDTYQRLLAWSHELLEYLRPHGGRDMIDVQSFIWTIAGPEA